MTSLDDGARARRDRGYAPVDRAVPRRMECAVYFKAPTRLLRDPGLSHATLKVGLAVFARAEGDPAMAIEYANGRIAHDAGVSEGAVPRALAALEGAGYLYRLDGRNATDLDTLEWVGYRDPWAAQGSARPARALVLLCRLPHPSTIGGGVEHATPGGRAAETLARARKGGRT